MPKAKPNIGRKRRKSVNQATYVKRQSQKTQDNGDSQDFHGFPTPMLGGDKCELEDQSESKGIDSELETPMNIDDSTEVVG